MHWRSVIVLWLWVAIAGGSLGECYRMDGGSSLSVEDESVDRSETLDTLPREKRCYRLFPRAMQRRLPRWKDCCEQKCYCNGHIETKWAEDSVLDKDKEHFSELDVLLHQEVDKLKHWIHQVQGAGEWTAEQKALVTDLLKVELLKLFIKGPSDENDIIHEKKTFTKSELKQWYREKIRKLFSGRWKQRLGGFYEDHLTKDLKLTVLRKLVDQASLKLKAKNLELNGKLLPSTTLKKILEEEIRSFVGVDATTSKPSEELLVEKKFDLEKVILKAALFKLLKKEITAKSGDCLGKSDFSAILKTEIEELLADKLDLVKDKVDTKKDMLKSAILQLFAKDGEILSGSDLGSLIAIGKLKQGFHGEEEATKEALLNKIKKIITESHHDVIDKSDLNALIDKGFKELLEEHKSSTFKHWIETVPGEKIKEEKDALKTFLISMLNKKFTEAKEGDALDKIENLKSKKLNDWFAPSAETSDDKKDTKKDLLKEMLMKLLRKKLKEEKEPVIEPEPLHQKSISKTMEWFNELTDTFKEKKVSEENGDIKKMLLEILTKKISEIEGKFLSENELHQKLNNGLKKLLDVEKSVGVDQLFRESFDHSGKSAKHLEEALIKDALMEILAKKVSEKEGKSPNKSELYGLFGRVLEKLVHGKHLSYEDNMNTSESHSENLKKTTEKENNWFRSIDETNKKNDLIEKKQVDDMILNLFKKLIGKKSETLPEKEEVTKLLRGELKAIIEHKNECLHEEKDSLKDTLIKILSKSREEKEEKIFDKSELAERLIKKLQGTVSESPKKDDKELMKVSLIKLLKEKLVEKEGEFLSSKKLSDLLSKELQKFYDMKKSKEWFDRSAEEGSRSKKQTEKDFFKEVFAKIFSKSEMEREKKFLTKDDLKELIDEKFHKLSSDQKVSKLQEWFEITSEKSKKELAITELLALLSSVLKKDITKEDILRLLEKDSTAKGDLEKLKEKVLSEAHFKNICSKEIKITVVDSKHQAEHTTLSTPVEHITKPIHKLPDKKLPDQLHWKDSKEFPSVPGSELFYNWMKVKADTMKARKENQPIRKVLSHTFPALPTLHTGVTGAIKGFFAKLLGRRTTPDPIVSMVPSTATQVPPTPSTTLAPKDEIVAAAVPEFFALSKAKSSKRLKSKISQSKKKKKKKQKNLLQVKAQSSHEHVQRYKLVNGCNCNCPEGVPRRSVRRQLRIANNINHARR